MMNRENEERPIAQTLCGALQREPNCKCLLLSLLIYICIAAVTWCRCTNVTKLMVNYAKFPIRSSKHITSPCDEGYIYIPVAFMGMLYLVYLVECYHSPIRIDLLHAESQDSVLAKLAQLKMARPTIWWRAVSYHYARRKRQITRYRNGDNYITTQVYYERVNTHVATSSYYYHYCGVKDISKDLVLGAKIPITKIMLTKGFAFSNMTSATEFEEIRSRFFAEQEIRDDYLEMREGLDIGNNVNSTMLVAVLGNPWFTNRYVYWCLSALLLSWPLRVIIEYKTQYADYQITKLFGVNYDTPTSGEPIHASMSQLSQPGSYMLAPSYSEALLMDPAPSNEVERDHENWQSSQTQADVETDMVPSYSEALLYERAEQLSHQNVNVVSVVNAAGNSADATTSCNMEDPAEPILTTPCEYHCPCPCHSNTNSYEIRVDERSYIEITSSSEHLPVSPPPTHRVVNDDDDTFESRIATLRTTADGRLHPSANRAPRSMDNLQSGASPSKCGSCGRMSISTQTINSDDHARAKSGRSSRTSSVDFVTGVTPKRDKQTIPCNISEPNLRSRSEPANAYLKENVKSLENILENEEEPMRSGKAGCASAEANLPSERPYFGGHQRWTPVPRPPSLSHSRSLSLDEESVSSRAYMSNKGAIPRTEAARSRITVNPISNEACWKLPNSKTYFCLKSILKQNRRRYTLVTADEYQNLADQTADRGLEGVDAFGRGKKDDVWADRFADRSRMRENFANPRRRMPSFEEFMVVGGDRPYPAGDQNREGTRTLIFASPLQKIPSSDPFGGKDLVPGRSSMERNLRENPTPVLARLARSTADREAKRRVPDYNRHRRVYNVQQERPVMHPFLHSHAQHQHQHQHQHPLLQHRLPSVDHGDRMDDFQTNETPYRSNVSLPPHNSLFSEHAGRRSMIRTSSEQYDRSTGDRRPIDLRSLNRRHQCAGLTRSFTERRPKVARLDRNFRRSFNGRVEDYRTEDYRTENYRTEDYRTEDYRTEDYRMENTKRRNFSMETSL
ncbi:PREDICTED: uncharacterized protein LOC106749847 isoform X2 [Dinoponera quadriceps]|uniref:Uncharacterized protein LOC106749847 isoform X2 n=1 Tax=Dinoponera quadriceps TaxID=609295 RepID=A0A6P3Y4I1_DINQU|nr:PREDICTED: uncharacterized protein LOC106749847 isoform X2 [Dinoponera quadriceps]